MSHPRRYYYPVEVVPSKTYHVPPLHVSPHQNDPKRKNPLDTMNHVEPKRRNKNSDPIFVNLEDAREIFDPYTRPGFPFDANNLESLGDMCPYAEEFRATISVIDSERVGAGKSTFGETFALCLSYAGVPAKYYPEYFDEASLKECFNKPKEVACMYQKWMLSERGHVYKEALRDISEGTAAIIDGSLHRDKSFADLHRAKGNISEEQYVDYLSLLAQVGANLKVPDHTICLEVSEDTAMARIEKRNRLNEKTVYDRAFHKLLSDCYRANLELAKSSGTAFFLIPYDNHSVNFSKFNKPAYRSACLREMYLIIMQIAIFLNPELRSLETSKAYFITMERSEDGAVYRVQHCTLSGARRPTNVARGKNKIKEVEEEKGKEKTKTKGK